MSGRIPTDPDGGMINGRLVFLCEDSPHGRQWHFQCPHCRQNHYHGAGEGHRNAHCCIETPLSRDGYYIALRSKFRGLR